MNLREIWKFPLSVTDAQRVAIPVGWKSVTMALQAGTPCLWALVDPDAKPLLYSILCYGTGHPIFEEDLGECLGTVHQNEGRLVWHFYEGDRASATEVKRITCEVCGVRLRDGDADGRCYMHTHEREGTAAKRG